MSKPACHREKVMFSMLSVKLGLAWSLQGTSVMTTCWTHHGITEVLGSVGLLAHLIKRGNLRAPSALKCMLFLSPQADWSAHLPWFSTTAKKPSMQGMKYLLGKEECQFLKCLSVSTIASQGLRYFLCNMAKIFPTQVQVFGNFLQNTF